jgi:hypothetical protein
MATIGAPMAAKLQKDGLYLSEACVAGLSEWLCEPDRELVAPALEQVRREMPVFAARDGSALEQALVESVTEHVRRVVVGLGRGREVPSRPSSAELDFAREVARRGVPADALLKVFRIVHREIWDVSVNHARLTMDADSVVAAMLVTSRYLFAFNNVVTRALIAAYEHEQADRVRVRQRRENQFVHDVLSGLPFDRTQVAYEFDRHHVGVVAVGEGVEAAIRRIAGLNGADVLVAQGAEAIVWAWLGLAREMVPPSVDLADAFYSGEHPADAVCVGLGEISAGIEGFRRTHRQAARAFEAARRYSLTFAAYHDVSLLALISVDSAACDEFMRKELGPLLESGRRPAGLRSTLDAYFATGQKSSAAKVLGVGDRTISYRLGSVEEALGRPIDTRRLELSVALRLARAHGVIDSTGGAL